MKIGFIGLGKLGMPVAVCMAMKGHDVIGFDSDKSKMSKNNYPYEEVGIETGKKFQDMLKESSLKFSSSIEDIVEHSELIFVAIQTPHDKEFEGVTRLTEKTKDFNYEFLKEFLNKLTLIVKEQKTVAIISTVAPGTYESEINPILKTNKNINYCYNPFFIAMGTVVKDFLNPEFVLIGSENLESASLLQNFYKTIHNKETIVMSTASAEITKMSYNTMIGLKICFANNVMELCHIFNGNCDHVTNAIKKSTDRLISEKYLSPGMGDGGGCHPRDNIVLSHLAKKHNMSSDFSGGMMITREKQAEWLVDLMLKYDLPKFVLGRSFKPETNIETGSPAVLCINLLKEKGFDVKSYEPFLDGNFPILETSVFLIGTKHESFKNINFPKGSVVIDPHGYIPLQNDVNIIHVGRN